MEGASSAVQILFPEEQSTRKAERGTFRNLSEAIENVSLSANPERRLFPYTEEMELDKPLSYFIRNKEYLDLKERFRVDAKISLENDELVVTYSRKDTMRELEEELKLLQYRCLNGRQMDNLRAISKCDKMRSYLQTRGFRLQEFERDLYLVGRNTYKREISDVRDLIYKHYCHQLKYFYYKKELSRKEKQNYEAIFAHTGDFERILTSNPGELVSIEPRFFKYANNSRWDLSFIVLAKKKIFFKELCQNIHREITSMQSLTLVLTTPTKVGEVVSKVFRYELLEQRGYDQQHMLITYRKSSVDKFDLEEYIRKVEKQLGCEVEGVVYDISELEVSAAEAITYITSIGCTPQEEPRRISGLFPKEADKGRLLYLLAKLSSVEAKELLEEDSQSDDDSVIPVSTVIDDPDYQEIFHDQQTDPSSRKSGKEDTQEEINNLPLFQKGTSANSTTIEVEGRRFRRLEVTPTSLFQIQYQECKEEELPVAILSYPYQSLTLQKCVAMNDQVEVMPLESAYRSQRCFLQGFYKKKAFEAGDRKCLAVRPCFAIERLDHNKPAARSKS